MSVRFNADGEGYQGTTGLPDTTYTCTWWGYISVDRDYYSTFLSLDSASGYMQVATEVDGTTLKVWGEPGSDITGGALASGTWYAMALVRNGSNATLYWGTDPTSLSSASASSVSAATPTSFRPGGYRNTGEWLNGRIAAVKLWDSVLTETQIEAELQSYDPIITSSLIRVHKLQVPEGTDYSGNGHTLTGGTGASTEADPPIDTGTTIDKTGGAAGLGAGSGAKTVTTGGGSVASVRSTSTGVEASSASHSVTIPAGTASGDVLVVAFAYDNITGGLNEANTASTGWVKLDRQSQGTGTNIAATLFWKRATGSDALTVTLTEAQEAAYVAVAVQGDGGDPLFAGSNGSAAPASFASATVTAGDYVSLLFVGIDANPPADQTITPPAGYSNLAEAEPVGAGSQVGMYALDSDALVTASTSIAPGSVGFSTSDQWVSFNVAIASPPAGTTIDKTGGAAGLGAGSGAKEIGHISPKTGGAAVLGAGSGAKTLGTAVPAQVYDLARWHWTLPTEDPGPDTDAEQIDQPALATYFDEHFYVDEDGYLTAVAPVNGFTTSGSGGTRSEGREHESNYDNSAWDPNTTEPRQFTITTRADPTSITGGTLPRQEEIIYQIHGASGTPPIYFAAEWTSNGVPVDPPRVRMFVSGTGMSNANVVSGITTDTPITIRVRVASAQLTAWVVAGEVADLPTTPTFGPVDTADFNDQNSWYFKAGAYNKTEVASGSTGQSVARISHWELLQPGDATTYTKTGGAAAIGAGDGTKTVSPAATYEKTGGAAAVGAGAGSRERTHDRAGGAAGVGAGDGARQFVRSFTGGAAAIGAGSGSAVVSPPAVHTRSGGSAALGAGIGAADVQPAATHDRTGGGAALGAGSGSVVVDAVTIHVKTGGAAALGAGSGTRQVLRSFTGGAAGVGAGSGAAEVTSAAVHEKTGGAAALGAGIGHATLGGAIEYSKTGGAAALGAGSGAVEVAHPAEHVRAGGAAALAAGSGARERTHDRTGGAAGVAAGSGAAEVASAAVHVKSGGAAALAAGAGQLELDLPTVHVKSGGAAGRGAGAGAQAVTHASVYVKAGGAAGIGAGIALKQVIPAAVHVRAGGAAAVGAGTGRGRVGGDFHSGPPRPVGTQRASAPYAPDRHHAGVT